MLGLPCGAVRACVGFEVSGYGNGLWRENIKL